jgi:hypothetical protein
MHLVTEKLAMELIQQVITIHILTTLSIYLSRVKSLHILATHYEIM